MNMHQQVQDIAKTDQLEASLSMNCRVDRREPFLQLQIIHYQDPKRSNFVIKSNKSLICCNNDVTGKSRFLGKTSLNVLTWYSVVTMQQQIVNFSSPLVGFPTSKKYREQLLCLNRYHENYKFELSNVYKGFSLFSKCSCIITLSIDIIVHLFA